MPAAFHAPNFRLNQHQLAASSLQVGVRLKRMLESKMKDTANLQWYNAIAAEYINFVKLCFVCALL
jgi:hypothetical protein